MLGMVSDANPTQILETFAQASDALSHMIPHRQTLIPAFHSVCGRILPEPPPTP